MTSTEAVARSLDEACALPRLLRGACAHPPLLYDGQLRSLEPSRDGPRLQELAAWEARDPLPPRMVRPRYEEESAAWWEAEYGLERTE
jgi:hypothetical protein